MTTPARSTVLAALIISDTVVHDLVTCPAGITYIVKDVRLYNGNAAAQLFSVYVQSTNNTTATLYFKSINAAATDSASAWVVMRAGDRLRAQLGGGPGHVYISGTRLQGTAVMP